VSNVRWRPVLLAGLSAAGLTFGAVYLVVTVYAVLLGVQAQGEPDQAHIQRFAEGVGAWLGTVVGVLFTFGGAAWVARRVESATAALHGVLVGGVVAVVGLAFGGSLGIVEVVGAVLTVAAGWLGGRLGGRGR
jgi:hypothetical protein